MPVLEVRHVSKNFGAIQALTGVSFQVERGEGEAGDRRIRFASMNERQLWGAWPATPSGRHAEGFRVPSGVRKSLMQEPAGRRPLPMGICASGCASACRELPYRMRWACRGSGFRARSQSL
jgi:hypothetical protein